MIAIEIFTFFQTSTACAPESERKNAKIKTLFLLKNIKCDQKIGSYFYFLIFFSERGHRPQQHLLVPFLKFMNLQCFFERFWLYYP